MGKVFALTIRNLDSKLVAFFVFYETALLIFGVLARSLLFESALPFFFPIHEITYIAGYLRTTYIVGRRDIEFTMTIFGQCYNVLNNNLY